MNRNTLLVCLITTFFFSTLPAQVTPRFLDSAPADATVDCFSDLPMAGTLRAAVIPEEGMAEVIVEIAARDSLGAASSSCDGGQLFRIWEAFDDDGTRAREEQLLTFGAAAPTDGPTIDPTNLPLMEVTVPCAEAEDPTSPNSYSRWISDRRIAVATAVVAGCAAIDEITDDGPVTIDAGGCTTETVVTFTVVDECGATATTSFTYRTEDTEAPVISGVTSELIQISCADPVPAVPTVTVDDCADIPAPIPVISSTQAANGSCQEYSYDITRSWTVTDDCGATTTVRQVIEVRDNTPPDFELRSPRNISCTDDYTDADFIGRPTNVTDNCTPTDELEITFTDEVIAIFSCSQNFNVRRTWVVTDKCGNPRVRVQEIRIRDSEAPRFDGPVDVSVACEEFENTAITGAPTRMRDNCDETPTAEFTDEIIDQQCAGTFTARRTWRVLDDCENFSEFEQIVTVIDTTPPFFTVAPQDLRITCNNERDQRTIFDQWVEGLAGARYTDGCGDSTTVTVQVTATGSDTFPQLPPIRCTEADGTVRRQLIDIRLTDDCGNTTVATVKYEQVDNLSINLFDCPESQVIPTDPGVCEAVVALPPPVIQDQCVSGLPIRLRRRDTVAITSAAMTETELGDVPVDPIVLNFRIDGPLPVNAQNNGFLTITLENADAEGADEFFFIYGEDRTLLGTTERANVQCSDVSTTVSLPLDRFNRYAADGTISITLEPNIPNGQPGSAAINNLCEDGSRVTAFLDQPIFRLTEIFYDIIIDGGEPMRIDPIDTLFVTLPEGQHQISYRVTDCGGNTDDCRFSITVEDRQPPVIACPADIEVILEADSCQMTLELPLPLSVEDNCEIYETTTVSLPATSDDRLFSFTLDPNLNTYQAQPKVVTLANVPRGIVDSVDITVVYTGAFDNQRAAMEVVFPDGNVAATTTAGSATCLQPGQLDIRLGAQEFSSLLSGDGDFPLTLRPRPVSVPPGQPGDGLIPCNADAVNANGDTDGISSAFVRITYRNLRPAYYTQGATVTSLQQTSAANPVPVVTFNQGMTDFIYRITDRGGNQAECTIAVNVRDTTPPLAVCQPTTIFVDPSGLAPVTVDPLLVDGGSSDNCGIDRYLLDPETFDCDQIGNSANVVLTVFDAAGNSDLCSTTISIAAQQPEPTASTTVCGGDTLLLLANPPTVAQPGQTIYTFRWFGPNGNLISTDENPVIPGVTGANSGAYRVVIRGITGCEAEGIANIGIGQIPAAPNLVAPTAVCEGDNAALSIPNDYVGSNIRFEWYRGAPGSGTRVGMTRENSFLAPFANNASQGDFYAIAFVNGCESPVSNVVTVRTTTKPVVAIDDRTIRECEFGTATFRASVTQNVVYQWTGPNGFLATGRNITIDNLSPDDAGTYYLRGIRSGGCFSEPDSLVLTVFPAEEPTTLMDAGPVCPSDVLVLTAAESGAAAYRFSGPNGQVIETDTSILRFTPVTNAVAGEWRVSIRRDRCFSAPSAPLTVVLGNSPVVTATTEPPVVCEGNDVVLQASSSISNSSYRWEGPNGFLSSSIAPVLEDVDSTINGDYILTVTSPNGCFTRDTLNIDVAPGIFIDSIFVAEGSCLNGGETVAIVASINSGSAGQNFSYFWEGPEGTSTNDTLFVPNVSLSSNGVYRLTVMNEGGCNSPTVRRSLELDFAPAPPAAPFTESGLTTVCEEQDLLLMTSDLGPEVSYLWRLPNGNSIPTTDNELRLEGLSDTLSGAYTVRAIRRGCTSLPSEARMITVTPYPVITVLTSGPACSGQPINFQATDIAGAVYSWRGPNNFSSSLPDPTIVSADATVHAGRYSVVASVNGCASDTSFVDVTVNPTPAVPVISPIRAICLSDEDAVLELSVNPNTASEGASYQWYISGGQVEVGEATDSLTLRLRLTDFGLFAGGGNFDFSVRALRNDCFSAASSAVTVRLDEAGLETADTGPDTTICAGLFLLEAEPINSGTGRWTLVQGNGDIDIINPMSNVTAISGMTEFGGPYAFAWTLSNGSCVGYTSDTVMVTVTDGEAAVAGDDIIACIREEVRLDATPVAMAGSGGNWSQALAQQVLGVRIAESTNASTVITGLLPDNVYSFIWTVTSNCGIKSDVVLVTVSDPSPFAGRDTTVCNGSRSANLNADVATRGSTGNWRALTEGPVVTEADNPKSPVNNLVPGENRFLWEVDAGFCGPRSRDTVTVIFKAPAAPRDDELDVSFQGTITFNPGDNDNNPAGSVINFPDPPAVGTLTANGDGSYTYRAPDNFVGETEFEYTVSSDGCAASSATVLVFTGQEVDCNAPNIFTPNNDGMNDRFVVPCLLDQSRYPESQVVIYNQWGDEVYKSGIPYANDWDGTYQGSELPVGTYFYIIDFGGARESESGDVRIER